MINNLIAILKDSYIFFYFKEYLIIYLNIYLELFI
jgi:hypothetical protein